MRSTIRELFHGNIRGFDSRQYAKDSPYMAHVRRRQENRDKLMELLTDEGKELFEAYEDAAGDILGITGYDTYEYTLRFAVSLMCEVFMCGGCGGNDCDDAGGGGSDGD